jgi:hypothetical protein
MVLLQISLNLPKGIAVFFSRFRLLNSAAAESKNILLEKLGVHCESFLVKNTSIGANVWLS